MAQIINWCVCTLLNNEDQPIIQMCEVGVTSPLAHNRHWSKLQRVPSENHAEILNYEN